ncbi:MAG: M20 family metallopeptidase [Chloroflexi bacterium]|nr:M20 family metallopeptidase [Chloroflexota bacterium]
MELKAFFEEKTDEMIALLRDLVAIESPTYVKAAVDRLGERLQQELAERGAEVEVVKRDLVGDIVIGRWHADKPGRPIALVCHMDTVYPIGTINDQPLREIEGRLYGPGTNDEKGGIVTTLMAIGGLVERGELPERPIIALFTSDEETGSEYSKDLIVELTQDAALALILEAALPDGSLKTWRKSTGKFIIRTHGKAAHAGGAHEYGVNAIEEMAHQIIKLQKMTNHKIGTTVSVGMVNGGIARNVIPDTAEIVVDVRAATPDEMKRMDKAIRGLKPELLGARVEVEGGFDRPPMVRDETMEKTFETAKNLAAGQGLTLREDGTGGASDGNFTADAGVPTLDGVGPIGTGAHSERENVLISSLARSATLLALLVRDWPA